VSKPLILALTPVEISQAERQLVAWWKFDETEGETMNDASGNDVNGTLVGAPQWQPEGGKVGGALVFDGVDDYVDCGYQESMNLTQAVSVSAWIKLAGPAEDQKIVSNQDNLSGGFKVSIFNNKIELEVRDSGNMPAQNRSVEGGTVLEPDVWYHVVGTYCLGGSIKTYVNGKPDREVATQNMLGASGGALVIGREPFQNLYWFKGLMDDLQIYNYPLSETEVAGLFSGQLPSLVAQVETPTLSPEEQTEGNNWIPVTVILAAVIAAAALIARKRKTTA